MTILKTTKAILCCAALAAISTVAEGAPLWNLDLDSMTPGSAPTTATYVIGGTNANPQTVGVGDVLVKNNFSVEKSPGNPVTLPGNSIVISKSVNGDGTDSSHRFTMIGNSADYTALTDYQLTFDILLSQSAFTPSTALTVRMANNSSTTYVGNLTFKQSGVLQLASAFGTTSTTEANVWNWGEVMHFTLQIDAANKLFKVYLNNSQVSQIALDPTGNANPNLGINRIWFGANSANTGFADGIGIANIETSTVLMAVPEPSHVALFTLGALVSLGWGVSMRRRAAVR